MNSNTNAGLGGAAGLLALIGGLVAGSKQQQNALAQEDYRNKRAFYEKNIEEAKAQGKPELIDDKVYGKYFTKDELNLHRQAADANSLTNNLMKLHTISDSFGQPGGQPGQSPSAPPAGAPAMQSLTTPPGTPDEVASRTAQPVAASTQPVGDPRDEVINKLRAENAAQAKLLAANQNTQIQANGRQPVGNVQPVANAQPTAPAAPQPSVVPLQPKLNITTGPNAEIKAINMTPPTGQQQIANVAGAQTKLNWLQLHPEVTKNNPGIAQAIAAGDEASHKLVEKMQNEGEVDPNAFLAIESQNLPWQQRNNAIISLMGVQRGSKYLAENPAPGQALAKEFEPQVRTEAMRLSLASGGGANSISPDIMKQAQANVLDQRINEANRKSEVTEARMNRTGMARATAQIATRTAMQMTKDVQTDSDFMNKGKMLLSSIAAIGDAVYSKKNAVMPTLTGVPAIDNPIKEAMAKFQSGDVGAKLSVVDSLANDMSVVEQRMFGGSSRVVESLRKATLGAIANPTRQSQQTFNNALFQSHRVMQQTEEKVKAKIKSAASMLRASEFTRPIADSFEKGYYDATNTYLQQADTTTHSQDFLPVVPTDNNWAPAPNQ